MAKRSIERFDLANGGPPGVPYRLRMIATERRHQIVEMRVDDRGEVRRSAAGVDPADAPALDERNAETRVSEQQRRCDSGQAAANDDDVGVERPLQRLELRQ